VTPSDQRVGHGKGKDAFLVRKVDDCVVEPLRNLGAGVVGFPVSDAHKNN